MRMKNIKKACALLLAVSCLFAAEGCAGGKKDAKKPTAATMSYMSGEATNGEYDSKLFGMNGLNDLGVYDPGCIYVSEEEDPKWGGYFYCYPGGFAKNDEGGNLEGNYYKENHISNYMGICFRSKDLYNWERVGSVGNGKYLCVVDDEDWCDNVFWAPECIRNPADGKYYYYCNSPIKQNWGVEGFSSSANQSDRFNVCIAVADTPVGPFDVLYDSDPATGKRIPTINFQKGCGAQYPWAVIDISPFFDDNGDFYLYLKKEGDDHYTYLRGIWGLKMKSMSIPDYSTVRVLAKPDFVTATSTPGQIEQIETEGEYYFTESDVNEGPFMIKHGGKYYLTYAANGYGNVAYSVHQAVSDAPLGPFRKLSADEGNPVLDGSVYGNMHGTAHHAFVNVGDELYILYHRHNSSLDGNATSGRSMDVDRVNWVTNSDGLEVLTANGPSYTLQWLPEAASGYEDLARIADISVSEGKGVSFLHDRVLPYYTVSKDMAFTLDSDKENSSELKITLRWDKPVSVSALMIYNSDSLETAFSKISEVRLKLAERPDWADKDYDYALIKDLKMPKRYYNSETETYIGCAPASAEFEPVKVTEITLVIDEKDRFMPTDRYGKANNGLKLSEIVVLGER